MGEILIFHFIIYFSQHCNNNILIMYLKRFGILRYFFSEGANTAQSVPGNKPPRLTDNPAGRYAGSLFSAASQSEALQKVLDDLIHLKGVIDTEGSFREILKNAAVSRHKQRQIFNSFAPQSYHQITNRFLRRTGELEKIIQTYITYCKVLNKEEDIRIISAAELTSEQKEKVIGAVKKSKPGIKFKISYEIEPSILGGLQIYAGTQFLDCSLRSRIDKLKNELHRIA